MESKIVEKKELVLGGRRIEVKIVECNINQHGYFGQRIYAKFLDRPPILINYNKGEKVLTFGKKKILPEELQRLKKIIDKIPLSEIYET